MKLREHDFDQKVFIVAEIGNNHEGQITTAEKMLKAAANAGADAVKFQTFIPELFVSPQDPERMARMKKFQLSFEDFENLKKLADSLNVTFFSTPLDLESAIFLNEIQEIFKIASCDNSFFQLIDLITSFNKPTIISTGLADLQLLDQVHRHLLSKIGRENENKLLAFLHCVSAYPVPESELNLGAIHSLKSRYPNTTIGYSDHSLGIKSCLFAVAAGARIIEKHFTLNKQYSDFRDHQLSADPDEFKSMVEQVREVEVMLSSGTKEPQKCELGAERLLRRSIAASRDIAKGELISASDLIYIRPGSGFPTEQDKDIIGKTVKNTITKGTLFSAEHIN